MLDNGHGFKKETLEVAENDGKLTKSHELLLLFKVLLHDEPYGNFRTVR